MAGETSLTRKVIEEKIVALAWKDSQFRERFLANPKAEFEKRLGVKFPASMKISAHAEDDTHLHFVIRAKPAGKLGELSDADLEKVAGGVDLIITTAVVGISLISAAALSAGAAVGDKKSSIEAPKW